MTLPSNITTEIKQRIETGIPGTQAEVIEGGNGHYTLTVISETFEGLTQLKQHQLVYSTFADLMSGANAPIHAIDKMDLRVK